MKKTYFAPEMEIVKVALSTLICTSYGTQPGFGGEGDPEENAPD